MARPPTSSSPQLTEVEQRTLVRDDSTQSRTKEEFDDDFFTPGAMLGDYRIEAMVAEGGWGTVFSAVHPLIGKRVAVKVLKKELCQRPAAVQRFVDEARAVAHIGHPNIVDMYTFGETPGGSSYCIMEWLNGETLNARIHRGRLSLAEVALVVRQLVRALEAAHEKGIIHRDLKPENIFLAHDRDEQVRVKLLDFGIAKLVSNVGDGKTETGQIVGTPKYMAPEQARGRNVDHRVDVYALGGIMFEMLAGRTAFQADNSADMIARLLTEPPPHVSVFAPEVPPALDAVIDTMLAKDARERPSLRHAVSVLDAALDSWVTPDAPRRPSRTMVAATRAMTAMGEAGRRAFHAVSDFVRPRRRRRRWLVIVGVASAVVAIAIVAVVLIRRGHGRDVADAPHREVATLVLSVSGTSAYEVFVDNRAAKPDANGAYELTPGTHSIEIRAPGRANEAFMVRAVAGGVLRESFELRAAPNR